MNGVDPQSAIYIASPIVIGAALLLVLVSGRLGPRVRRAIVQSARAIVSLLLLGGAALCALHQSWFMAAAFTAIAACCVFPALIQLGRGAAGRLRGARG